MNEKIKSLINALINEDHNQATMDIHAYITSRAKALTEARRKDLKYTDKIMKDKIERVTVELAGSESAVFTRAAKRYKQIDRLLAAIQEKRNELNEVIKDKVLDYFDGAADEIYTRYVETVSMTAAMSKKQADTPASTVNKVDYEALTKKLLEMVPEIEDKFKELLTEFTTIEKIAAKEGKSPSLSVKIKDDETSKKDAKAKVAAMVGEGIGDWFAAIKSKLVSFMSDLKSWGSSYDKKLADIGKEMKGGKKVAEATEKMLDLQKFRGTKLPDWAWPDNLIYRDKNVYKTVYDPVPDAIASAEKKLKEDAEDDGGSLSFQEVYLGYSPSADLFVLGFDGWSETPNPDYDEDDDETGDEMEHGNCSPYIAFKINDHGAVRVQDAGADISNMGLMWYSHGKAGNGLAAVHKKYHDIIDVRLD